MQWAIWLQENGVVQPRTHHKLLFTLVGMNAMQHSSKHKVCNALGAKGASVDCILCSCFLLVQTRPIRVLADVVSSNDPVVYLGGVSRWLYPAYMRHFAKQPVLQHFP